MSDKVLENRLRRVAKRRGLHLMKSRVRDPHAIDYGSYYLAGSERGAIVYETSNNLGRTKPALEEIRAYLDKPPKAPIVRRKPRSR